MIRPYREDDLPTLVEIANRAWLEIYQMFRQAYGDELFDILISDEKTSKGEQVRSHCRSHPDCILVCEEEDQIVGFVTFRINADRQLGEIGNNGVHHQWRGRGIGQQLYSAALQRFRDQGMRYARVHTGLDWAHAPARRAYERAGFDIKHEDVDYYMKL